MGVVKTIKAIPFKDEKVKAQALRDISLSKPKTADEWAEVAFELERLIDRSCEAYVQGLSSDVAIWFTGDMQAILRALRKAE